ncbi:MAG: SRPBCC family protein [Euryarchaeota archaeon]|nr:SRPBCC family protein [Euryarchaeota archaeon]
MKIERTIEVETSPFKAYKVLSDPTNIPRYSPDIERVAITSITPRLVGTRLTLHTHEHKEMQGEVIEAASGESCAFKTDTGRLIRWTIQSRGKAVRLHNTIDTEEEIDEGLIGPELDRKLRALRNNFQTNRL